GDGAGRLRLGERKGEEVCPGQIRPLEINGGTRARKGGHVAGMSESSSLNESLRRLPTVPADEFAEQELCTASAFGVVTDWLAASPPLLDCPRDRRVDFVQRVLVVIGE